MQQKVSTAQCVIKGALYRDDDPADEDYTGEERKTSELHNPADSESFCCKAYPSSSYAACSDV